MLEACQNLILEVFPNKPKKVVKNWIRHHIGTSLQNADNNRLVLLVKYLEEKKTGRHCSLHVTNNAKSRRKLAGDSSNKRFNIRAKLVAKHGIRCRYCRSQFDDISEITLDHIRPVHKGGETILENMQLLCKPCHLIKTRREHDYKKDRLIVKNRNQSLSK